MFLILKDLENTLPSSPFYELQDELEHGTVGSLEKNSNFKGSRHFQVVNGNFKRNSRPLRD